VWASDHRLKTLAKRGYITLFDSTHKTNLLQFKLFTWMCRTEVNHKTYLPCAGARLDDERGDTIAAALAQICHWIKDLGLEGGIKYALTDDSAAEQRAVALTFTEESKESLGNVYVEVEHLLCQWHCKQTLNRQLHGDVLAPANRHLQAVLWSRRTGAGCDESIKLIRSLTARQFRGKINHGIRRGTFVKSGKLPNVAGEITDVCKSKF
jgi:MULE transposase domain